MNQSKILIFFLVFCCGSFQAQDTILPSKNTKNAIITYDPKGLLENKVNNTIIREIAKDLVKSLKKTQLLIRTDLNSCLLRKGEATYLKIELDSFELSGDHFYRKISFSDVMKPSSITFTLQLRSIQDSLIINEFMDLSLHLKRNDSILLPLNDGAFYKNSAFLQIDNIRFFFNDDDLLAFNQRQRLIDDYYASAAIADSLEPVIRSIDFTKTSFYPEYFIQIEEISKIEQLIRFREMEKELSLGLNDPKGLSRKCYDLLRFSRSAVMTFDQALDTLPVLNSRISEDSLISEYLEMIQRYIRWSFLINERNSVIYREFLDRFYKMNAFEDDQKMFTKLIGRVYPIINADSIARELIIKLKKAYQKKAEALTEQSRYAEAISFLDHERKLEEKFNFLEDSMPNAFAREKAARGIFLSYLGVAENSLNSGKNTIARFYLDRASEYAKSNPILTVSDSVYRKVFSRYQQSLMISCDALAENGDFEKALECYNELAKEMDSTSSSPLQEELGHRISMAREGMLRTLISDVKKFLDAEMPDSTMIIFDQAVSLKEKIDDSTETTASLDSLKPFTEQYRYDHLIKKIEQYQKNREFTSAYIAYEQAREIALKQQLSAGILMDSIYRTIYPKYMEEQLARARPLIWTNQFIRAGNFADSVSVILAEKGFDKDPGVRSALESYKQKIKERICWEAEERIHILYIRAHRNIVSLNYIKALSLLDSALIISRDHPDCLPETDDLMDTVRKYMPAKQYQEKMIKTEGNISLGMYDEFVPMYLETGLFHKNNSLWQFGLTWSPVYDFVEVKSREGLTYSVCSYYLVQGKISEAFRYLKLLKRQGYPAKDAREIMLSIGKEMAILDHQSQSYENPEDMIQKYTEGDEWFAIFVKAYLKEWKNYSEK